MMIKKIYVACLLSGLLFPAISHSQVVFWSENFNNGCSSNCNAASYSGTNGACSVSDPGTNGNIPNEFFVSCAENGEPVGSCGAGCGNDATLHVASVPCTLCFACINGDCGAAYNAGPSFGGEDPLTIKRAESPLISTLGKSGITLEFKYIERGQGTSDNATLEYSINGGSTWLSLVNMAKTATTCGSGQGLWTAYSIVLPATCDNISNLKIGFRWVNNSDGTGSDPSFAVDNVELSTVVSLPPVADFNTPLTTFCDSTCISFADLSQNGPTGWSWLLPGATPSSYSGQTPVNICYDVPGTYDVTLIVTNAAGADTINKAGYITVNSCFLPQVSFIASDSSLCEKKCIDFTDLSTNNPTSWQWYFPGAAPDTSTMQNPTGICYNTYGVYTVKLIATNVVGSDSAEYTGFILVNQAPAAPVVNLSGGNILTSTPAFGYQWYFNSAPVTGGVNQVYLAQASGDYFVVITDSNGCQAASNIVFVGFQGVMQPDDAGTLLIHPNPATDMLFVNLNALSSEIAELKIYDLTGRTILENRLVKSGVKEFRIDISFLESGTYLISIQSNKQRLIKKLLKE